MAAPAKLTVTSPTGDSSRAAAVDTMQDGQPGQTRDWVDDRHEPDGNDIWHIDSDNIGNVGRDYYDESEMENDSSVQ